MTDRTQFAPPPPPAGRQLSRRHAVLISCRLDSICITASSVRPSDTTTLLRRPDRRCNSDHGHVRPCELAYLDGCGPVLAASVMTLTSIGHVRVSTDRRARDGKKIKEI